MTNPIYDYLREMDIPEAEIEQMVGEGWNLRDLLVHKVEQGVIDPSTGDCCCGSPVEGHGLGDGHAPVDDGWYYYDRLINDT